jgi:hypothetical protein
MTILHLLREQIEKKRKKISIHHRIVMLVIQQLISNFLSIILVEVIKFEISYC